jgi:hypothetical protein
LTERLLRPRFDGGMPALARRRNFDADDEMLARLRGDVRVGATALRAGMPHHEDPWTGPAGPVPGSRCRPDTSSSHFQLLCRLGNACWVSSMEHAF